MSPEVPVCFLCRNAPATSDEHIILLALGGRRICKDFIYLKCNNKLGNEIDAPLEQQLRPFAIRQKSLTGRKEPVSSLAGLVTPTGEKAVLHADQTISVLNNRTFVETIDGKQSTIIIHEKLRDFALMIVGHIVRDRLWEKKEISAEHYSQPDFPGTIRATLTIGGDEAFRSVAKMGLALLCKNLSRAAMDGLSSLEWARVFVSRGTHSAPRRFTLDLADAPVIRSALGSKIGEHVALITSNWLSTDAVFLAHGVIPYRVAISKPPIDCPNFALILNPTTLEARTISEANICLESFIHIAKPRQSRLNDQLTQIAKDFNSAFPDVSETKRERKNEISSDRLREALVVAAMKPHRLATHEEILKGIEAYIRAIELSKEQTSPTSLTRHLNFQ